MKRVSALFTNNKLISECTIIGNSDPLVGNISFVASEIDKVSRKANISGTFTSYLKDLKNSRKRIRELAQLNVPILSDDALPKGSSYNLDALEFLKQHSADVIYLDPPSSVVQYYKGVLFKELHPLFKRVKKLHFI